MVPIKCVLPSRCSSKL
ncbi:hypothetical protein D018_3440A, partial [Vibrio parahaemolyticus VP2007-007]